MGKKYIPNVGEIAKIVTSKVKENIKELKVLKVVVLKIMI